MIFDKMFHADKYLGKNPDMQLVHDFAKKFDQFDLTDGVYKLDGDRVFANVQGFHSKHQTQDMMFEAHRDYIDVQYVVSGMERIRCANINDVQLVEEYYSKGKDIAFYEGDSKADFILTKGTFLYLEPQDVHLPGLSVNQDAFVRKIVFKLHI